MISLKIHKKSFIFNHQRRHIFFIICGNNAQKILARAFAAQLFCVPKKDREVPPAKVEVPGLIWSFIKKRESKTFLDVSVSSCESTCST